MPKRSTIVADEFKAAVIAAMRFCGSGLPVLLEFDKSTCRVRSTDRQCEASMGLGADGDAFNVLLPGVQLKAIAQAVSGDVEISLEKAAVAIRSGGADFDLPTADAKEFAGIKGGEGDQLLAVDADSLKRAIAAVAPAAEDNSQRFALGAVSIELDKGGIWLIASDGRALANAHLPCEHDASGAYLVPTEFMAHASPCLREGLCEIMLSANQAAIKQDGCSLATLLLSGRFPKWRQAIPPVSHSVTVDRRKFLAAVAAACALHERVDSNDFPHVDMTLKDGMLSLTGDHQGRRAHAQCLTIDPVGDPSMEISFRGNYLRAAARAMDGEQLTLSWGKSDAVSISDGDAEWLVMGLSDA